MFEMQPDFPQWSESEWPDFGQQGCVGATGDGVMAAQAIAEDTNTNISSRTGISLSPFATNCAVILTAQERCKSVAELQLAEKRGGGAH